MVAKYKGYNENAATYVEIVHNRLSFGHTPWLHNLTDTRQLVDWKKFLTSPAILFFICYQKLNLPLPASETLVASCLELIQNVLNQVSLERFSNECRKTKTKVIIPANHNKHKLSNEPIRTRSKYMLLASGAGKNVRARASHH